ncbi:hypothetical protein PESP_a2316 [Pseudoalteromonas espejiana DSM 9414]|uniref:histidine kinase n=1 Tax=Pseudoalteromonas espejiana TaxID=28107 RepID=A0A510Y2M6_9GAMM|nr:PAS domain-containing sensor histidine kinase [Pseudoalteromonas espejiana]ASM50303.1 hypothetical protein PESP_a2316 [Pseudoalteromonas espejiana DSM 9414]GEK56877.1 hypothetical protein PES01_37220 [Pseudoalteromonas espejiana]
MPSIESYIGTPSTTDNKLWSVFLDSDIQTNLDSICDLVLSIFDAKSCTIIANFPQSRVNLSQRGDVTNVCDADLKHDQFVESLINESQSAGSEGDTKAYRLVSPIILPSNLKFGWLIVERISTQPLTSKEVSVFGVLQKDIVNHLVQRKQIVEQKKAAELQATITQLNRDFIFIKDENFKIVYANDAFINSYPPSMHDKVIGYTTVESFEAKEADLFLEQDKIAFEKGLSKVVENIHMPNGNRIIVETTKKRFEDKSGAPLILCVCRDLTEKEGLINRLKKANRELDEFTSIASHDLRAPLNAIKRLLEWISDDCETLLPDEHLENFQLVISRANRMQTLLEDLLKYAKIDQCDVTLSTTTLEAVYQDVAQLLDIPSSMTINIDSGNSQINIPAVPFKTVILNLLSNAIKHNDKTHGIINISLRPALHYYVIEVTDNGPGIEPKYFSLIFQLFQTLRSRDEVEGTGIGLSVVKKHVTNFGGKVDVSSNGKTGTTFTIFWPKQHLNS